MTLDQAKFLAAYVQQFGAQNANQTAGINFLTGKIKADNRFDDSYLSIRKLCYILATFKWETAHTMQPIDEIGSTSYFNNKYGPSTRVGQMLGNDEPGDGAKYHGRGYVQITGKTNYERAADLTGLDIAGNPELAKEPNAAYEIAIHGMLNGMFTGKKLGDYILGNNAFVVNYIQARRVINGSDKANEIAAIAKKMEAVFDASQK